MNNVWFVGQRHHQLIGCTTTTTTTTKTKTKRKLGLYPPPVVRPPSSLLTLALRWDSSSSSIFFFVWGFPFFLSVRVYTQPSFSYYYLFFFVLCFYLCVFDHERCSAECFEIDAVSSISLSLSLSPLPSFPSFAWCAHQQLIEAWTIQTAASMTFVRETPWRRADEWYRTRHSPSGDAYPSWRKLGGDGRRGRKDDERLTSKEATKRLFSLVSFSCLLLLRLLTFLLVRFKLVDVRARLISLAVRSTSTFHWAVRQSVPPSLRPSVWETESEKLFIISSLLLLGTCAAEP